MAFDEDLPDPSAKYVLLAISFRANRDGQAWPSLAAIAKDTALSPRTVRYAVRRLVDLGLLTVVHRPGSSLLFQLSTDTAAAGCRAATGAGTAATAAGDRGNSKHGELVKERVKERGGRAKHAPGCPCKGTGWLETWDPATHALVAIVCPSQPARGV